MNSFNWELPESADQNVIVIDQSLDELCQMGDTHKRKEALSD